MMKLVKVGWTGPAPRHFDRWKHRIGNVHNAPKDRGAEKSR